MLSRLAVEIREMPRQYESYTVETWIEGIFRSFTSRNFCVCGSDGRIFAYARSVWAMIDLASRKAIDLVPLYGADFSGYLCPEKPCPIGKPGRIAVKDAAEVLTLRPAYSDIDINGHFNSIKYIEHVLDLFPPDRYRTSRVRRFEMAYMAESYPGDELTFRMEKTGEEAYNVEIRKNSSEAVCRCRVEFDGKA